MATSVPHPVDQPAAALTAVDAASRRVLSTVPAATTCRYSTVRDSSSTWPAKSAASRKPYSAASPSAVDPRLFSSSRARSRLAEPSSSDDECRPKWLGAGTACNGRAGHGAAMCASKSPSLGA